MNQTRRLEREIARLEKILHYHLAVAYSDTKAWALTAWEIERLAEETLPQPYNETIKSLRQNLYAYISSLGAEWPAEEENHILLPGTYIEAAKTLKALWLSLHLATLSPAEEPRELPSLESLYPLYQRYTRLHRTLTRMKPIPFRLADRFLTIAALTALTTGSVEPRDYEVLGIPIIVADMVWALTALSAKRD
jgi:hypothetical protein